MKHTVGVSSPLMAVPFQSIDFFLLYEICTKKKCLYLMSSACRVLSIAYWWPRASSADPQIWMSLSMPITLLHRLQHVLVYSRATIDHGAHIIHVECWMLSTGEVAQQASLPRDHVDIKFAANFGLGQYWCDFFQSYSWMRLLFVWVILVHWVHGYLQPPFGLLSYHLFSDFG